LFGASLSRVVRIVGAAGGAAAIAVTMAGAIPASADAGPGAAVLEGTATLSSGFPGAGGGSFTGCAEGASVTAGTATCIPVLGAPNASASYSYDEPCALGTGVVLAGFAAGTVTIGGATEDFEWVRVGLSAVILLDQTPYSLGTPQAHANGGAVSVFVPLGVPGTNCSGNPAFSAQVVSIGAWEPVSA
jgi:hypothetical protein